MRQLCSAVAPLLLSATMCVLGCGDDTGNAVDGGNSSVDAGADAAPPGPFSSPEDFSGAGCTAPPNLDDDDLTGLWHLDLALPGFGSFAGTMRFYPGQGADPYRAVLFGADQDTVSVTPTSVLTRRAWTNEQGFARIRALLLCRVNGDGSFSGFYATCSEGECTEGSVDSYRVDDNGEAVSSNMTLIAEYAGPAGNPWPTGGDITANVRVKDGLAYVVRFGDGLRIVDVSTPSTPSDVGHSPVAVQAEIYNDIKLVDGTDGNTYALVASSVRGAVVIDVTNPASPAEVDTFPQVPLGENRLNVHTIFVEGTRAYLANNTSGGIDIYDIADPTNPIRLGDYVHPSVSFGAGFVHDLFVENQVAYLNYWGIGMVLVDTADPGDPKVLGTFDSYDRRTSHSNWVTTAGGRKISVHGDEDFDAHVRIVDVDAGSVAFLNEIGSYQTRPQVSVHNIMAVGNLAFITYYQDGLRVLDLSDPTQPAEIAHYRTWPGASGLSDDYGFSFFEGAIGVEYDVVSGLLYVADTHRGLFILRLDAP